jgi:DNA-binding LacI/PurR family transcriptional regulator
VVAYLDAEFERTDLKGGSRLPTVRQLASHLRVSVQTVHNVYQDLAKRGRIRTEVGNGTFLVALPEKKTNVFRLTVNLYFQEVGPHDDWAYRIGGGILHAAMHPSQDLVLVPVSNRIGTSADLNQKLLANLDFVDGVILLPLAGAEEARASFERAGKLVVNLNPPSETATSNFVSSDTYGACRQLGRVWQQSGRRRIAFVLGRSLNESVSSRLEYSGLVNGLGEELGRSIVLRTFVAGDVREEHGFRATQSMLADSNWQPDAIFCFGDLLALGAMRALGEKGLKIPADVSVVGGTGLSLSHSHCPRLTRMHQPCERLGAELVAMMCQRIEQKGASIPGRFLAAPFVGGAATRPDENALLNITPQGENK